MQAENFAVVVYNTVVELIAKQKLKTIYSEKAPLEMLNPLLKLNVCNFLKS